MSTNQSFSNIASQRYALALYELAKEQSVIQKVEEEAEGLLNLIKKSPDFKNLISNPIINSKDRAKSIENITSVFNISKITKNFLGFINKTGRIIFLQNILENFQSLASKNKNEIKANLISSKKLTDKEIELLQDQLSLQFGSKIKLNYKFDDTLIGGLIIQVGSIMIDSSLKTKLNRLEKIMVEN